MDRFQEIEVFLAACDGGSFVKAGQRMRMSPPAVTRAISALEDRLGARLFNRTTRSLALTDVGERFHEKARGVLESLRQAELEAVGEMAEPKGHLTVTASVTLGRSILAPVICAFLREYPQVTVSALLLDRVTNLVEEGIDAAIRIGALPDSTLVAKRLGSVRRLLVASPAYLERHGIPKVPSDLAQHRMIAFTGLMPNREWRFLDGRSGKAVSFMPRFEINDAVSAIAAAEAGDGITVALSYMVARQMQSGTLVAVLDEVTPPAVPAHLVFPQSRHMAPKLRAFVDFASPRIKHAIETLEAADQSRVP
ncbi:MAG: LysR family transcriptional regulator [Tabrizicola sp.]|nr:LysR family transcriptional regulator [Tabrizicola sp.]